MTESDAQLADRLASIDDRIAAAARQAGRSPEDITRIVVTKFHPASLVEELYGLGVRDVGENRVQEVLEKVVGVGDLSDLRWHFVGQLQTNKARAVRRVASVIHSLDRPSLVRALARAMDRTGRRIPCFVQVDVGEEEQKGGCAPGDLAGLLEQARGADVPVVGLMCVPPLDIEPAPYFALLDKLARDNGLAGRSMGMSGDFETAIMLGATHVRVGTALFGERASPL